MTFLLPFLLGFTSTASAADAKVDVGHSAVLFKAHHFSAGYTWGRFNDFSGTVSMDGNVLTGVDITVKAESIDTGNERRDKHLRSPDFFDTAQHETITFRSASVSPAGEGVYQVTGELTLHGQRNTVTVEMRYTGEADLPVMVGGGHATGWETSFSVKQSDYGMQYDAVGDEAFLVVSLEVKS